MDKKLIMLNKKDIELDKDKLKKKLRVLVDKFIAENGWSKSEEHIQTSFTIELLKLLGWDSANWIINQGQDVQTGKKPDIILKSNTSKFLVIESKDATKKDKLDGSYQTKTFTEQLFGYCETEGLYWGVLTNFVEWRLYAVNPKRLYKDKKYAFCDLLWENTNKDSYIDLLSDDGLSFLNKISRQSLIAKNGKISSNPIYYPQQLDLEQEKIKKEFFNKIKNWRAKLKTWITKNYTSQYNTDEIDLMAQKILDRMIFMDICHDKGVINENHIQSVLSATKRTKYDELKDKFILMDEKFNTELFAANEIDKIKINDEVIVSIIEELNDIDFSKLSVHIIGEVYENYLGELAKSRTTDEKKISDKQKKKRKSQGIYYTPDYIVEYIVKNTVGELLAKVKTTAEIEKIRVLDPACGSGSFLIRVFDEFLNAYRRVMKVPEGQTMWDEFIIRKKILQNNIFGVDLDAKAVEITKLNLMIKALDRIKPQDLKGNHLLPNLNLNIRCGNSLVGGEKLQNQSNTLNLYGDYKTEIDKLADLKISFYKESDDQKKKDLLAEISKLEEVINKNINKGLDKYFANLDKVRPFNYTVAFCEIFKAGGFDAVIGNPPYVDVRKINTEDKKFLFDCYATVENRTNTFSIFIESGLNALGTDGLLGFIIPNTILTHSSYKKLREMILNGCNIKNIYNLGSGIFKDAMVETIILIVEKEITISSANKINVCNYAGNFDLPECFHIKQGDFKNDSLKRFLLRNNKYVNDIILKLREGSVLLEDVYHGFNGINPGNIRNKVVVNKKIDEKYKKVIDGKNIKRYSISWGGEWVLYDKKILERARDEEIFLTTPKIMMQKIGTSLVASLDHEQLYALINTTILLKKEGIEDYDQKFILALLNSRLLNFYYKEEYLGVQIKTEFLEQLPIKKIETSEEKKVYNKIIDLVDEMLKLNKAPESREKNKTKIEAVNYEIDKLVYKLYGLTEGEIKVIENKYEA
jgi:adenine-specific DNA-methyltransferase